MYLVISCWEALPGKEKEFETTSNKVAALMRQQPGVVLLERMKSGNRYWSAHGYKDEASYKKIVQDPQSFFNKALAEHQVDKIARWISSERGETLPH